MFVLKFMAVFTLSVFMLCSCSSMNNFTNSSEDLTDGCKITLTSKKQYTPTAPSSIQLFVNKKVKTPYILIGKIIVSNYNSAGIKRQHAFIHDLMRKEAAKVGGNAIINIKVTNKQHSGDIIRFAS